MPRPGHSNALPPRREAGAFADRFEQAALVEPVDPFERGELHRLEGPPGAAPVYHLGLVEAVDGLREGVVKAVADAADRGLNASLGQPFGVADQDVLHSSVAVVHEPTLDRPSLVQGLLQGIQYKAGVAVRNTRQPTAEAQQADMTFFVTSTGSGKGADLGGLSGADQLCARPGRPGSSPAPGAARSSARPG